MCSWAPNQRLRREKRKAIKHPMTARILIADDSGAVRRSLHGLLEQNPDWKVCAEAVDGPDVIAKAEQFKPDIIVVDFLMPRMTGIEAAGALRRLLPCIPILIFTMDITDQLVEQAKSAGIKGAVQKSNTKEMMRAVDALLHRGTFFKKRHIN